MSLTDAFKCADLSRNGDSVHVERSRLRGLAKAQALLAAADRLAAEIEQLREELKDTKVKDDADKKPRRWYRRFV